MATNFTNYNSNVIDVAEDLSKLYEISLKLELNENAEAIKVVRKKLKEKVFNVGIVGEFKRGKSTLINALLGKSILPTDIIPATAALNKVSYGEPPLVRIEYRNGDTEETDIDKLADYVTKLTKESAEKAKTIKEATVYYPIDYCRNGVNIIDTPGLNDNTSMTEITMEVVPQLDAAVMVISTMSPYSQYEDEFLRTKILASDMDKVLFVVNIADGHSEEEAQRVIATIHDRIQENSLNKAKNSYGEDSKEYEAYEQKIGKPKVYGLYAKKALKAKISGDSAMLQQSAFPIFETALEKFLTEGKGAITLRVPLNRIKTSATEIARAVTLRENALQMTTDDFQINYDKAMYEMEKIKKDRQLELDKIDGNATRADDELLPLAKNYWPTMEEKAKEAIDSYQLSGDDISQKKLAKTQEAMTEAVRNAMAEAGQALSEQIQAKIDSALMDEAERLSEFEKNFFTSMETIQNLFVVNNSTANTSVLVKSAIAESVFFGVGGVYLGYKQAGWKGALLGGAASAAGGFASGVGVTALATALAIPLAWPALLVVGTVMAITGIFSGKWALNKFMPGASINKFKDSFKAEVSKQIEKMKNENDFADSVQKQVKTAFAALKDKIKTETDNTLKDMKNQLDKLKFDIERKSILEEKEKRELEEIVKTVNAICERADVLNKSLLEVIA